MLRVPLRARTTIQLCIIINIALLGLIIFIAVFVYFVIPSDADTALDFLNTTFIYSELLVIIILWVILICIKLKRKEISSEQSNFINKMLYLCVC